jgi:ankyrin repeat protein
MKCFSGSVKVFLLFGLMVLVLPAAFNLNDCYASVEISIAIPLKEAKIGEELVFAIYGKDLKEVERLIKEKPEWINRRMGATRHTPLENAARTDDLEIVELLVKAGAKVASDEKDFRSPLRSAKSVKMAEYLVSKGADVKRPDALTYNILHSVILLREAKGELIDYYVSKGANVNEPDKSGVTPLKRAYTDAPELIGVLVKNGAVMEAVDIPEKTPIDHAIKSDSTASVGFLVKKGADINRIDGLTKVPAVHSCRSPEMIAFVASIGADVNAKDSNGNTLLHLTKDLKMIRALIAAGADINATNRLNETALFAAVASADFEKSKLLIDKGIDISVKSVSGELPIHDAPYISKNDPDTAEIEAHKKMIELLMNAGMDINAADNRGTTPIFAAGSFEIIKFMVSKGAKLNVRGGDGYTPLHGARTAEIASYYLKNGADINARGQQDWTPLILAAYINPDIVDFLLDNGADMNIMANDGGVAFAAIHIAAKYDRVKAVESMIKHGVDINMKDSRGWTPLYMAVSNGSGETAKLLRSKGAKE